MSAPIIITVPNYLSLDGADSKVGILDACPTPPSRKRRLDHLSWEEKMQRKKLKNRVAAQTSRDRKKAKMDEMDDRIQSLEEANEKLVSEMASLRALNERLVSENEELRKHREGAAARCVGRAGPAGPAESTPRQQEGPALPASRAARLLLAAWLLSQMSSRASTPPTTSTAWSSSLKASSMKLMQKMKERVQMPNLTILDKAQVEVKWWGPHQSSWNPVEVQS